MVLWNGGGVVDLSDKGRELEYSVAMAIADVFPKNGYTISDKIAKILKIFERLETLKSWWVISQC